MTLQELWQLFPIFLVKYNKEWKKWYNTEKELLLKVLGGDKNLIISQNGFSEKVFHIHLRLFGDNDELYFRDYLIDNVGVAKEYEQLKSALAKKYEHDRDGYTFSKTEFIKEQTQKAKDNYKDRYKR